MSSLKKYLGRHWKNLNKRNIGDKRELKKNKDYFDLLLNKYYNFSSNYTKFNNNNFK